MGTDHNGKKIKEVKGSNVRITTDVFNKIRSHAWKKGWRIGAFFESAALEKMQREIISDREAKKSLNSNTTKQT